MAPTIANGVYFIRNTAAPNNVLRIDPLKRVISGTVDISALDSQLFKVEFQTDTNIYLLTNPSTGFALEVAGGNSASGTPVVLSSPSGGTSQSWDIQPVIGQSKYHTVTNLASHTVLEETGTPPQVTASILNAYPSQYWGFQLTAGFDPAPKPPVGLPGLGRPGDTMQVKLFPTGNICGNPQCGRTFICAADYNRNVKPLGYPGV